MILVDAHDALLYHPPPETVENKWKTGVIVKVQRRSPLKTNGINGVFAIFLGVVSNHAVFANLPYPQGSINIQLAQGPTPLSLTIKDFPVQKALSNSDFNFNIKPFISASASEINYKISNLFTNYRGKTSDPFAINLGIFGLPIGVVQAVYRAGDCSPQVAISSLQSCLLRFVVDQANYTAGQVSNGPVVSYRIYWLWGSHRNRPAALDTTAAAIASARITTLLALIMIPAHALVSPATQDGLTYDPATSSIVGKPTRTGDYLFTVSATNGYATAAPQPLHITAFINPKDTPVFNPHPLIASAILKQKYQLNLMELIESTPGFMQTNQVSFRIEMNKEHPDWLSIDKDNKTVLQGYAPASDAGFEKEITIIATSNTGGDSLPFTIKIPVTVDSAKKPLIEKDIVLNSRVGIEFHHDFRSEVSDPTADSNSLKIIVDTITPKAPWLHNIPENPTELMGIVPMDAVGQHYQMTLHANTAIGGDSASATIPLQIAIDETQTPRFYSANPQLPLLYAGQPYSYDFVANNDVSPDYSKAPYTVELAEGHNNPTWLRIENNKLIADRVPDNLEQIESMFITIKNIPGGKSKVLPIKLTIMN